MSVEKKIKEITNKIVREFDPEKVILFGSYAWGKPGPDSDVDLFVVKETSDPSLKRIEKLDRIFSRRDFPEGFSWKDAREAFEAAMRIKEFVSERITK